VTTPNPTTGTSTIPAGAPGQLGPVLLRLASNRGESHSHFVFRLLALHRGTVKHTDWMELGPSQPNPPHVRRRLHEVQKDVRSALPVLPVVLRAVVLVMTVMSAFSALLALAALSGASELNVLHELRELRELPARLALRELPARLALHAPPGQLRLLVPFALRVQHATPEPPGSPEALALVELRVVVGPVGQTAMPAAALGTEPNNHNRR